MAKRGKPKRRKSKSFDPLERQASVAPAVDGESPLVTAGWEDIRGYLPAIIGFFAVLLYSYWPTFVWIEDRWRNEPDYSHGYLVPFLAGLLCWYRSDSFPGIRRTPSWLGLSLIGLAIVMRIVSRWIYADFLDGWSLLPLLAGVIWVCLGPEVMKWSLPSVAFLFLMIPMPWRAENLLSWRLQGVATELSTIFLRVLGQPAVAEGHVIWLGDQQLLVEQACSGLRIFVGVAALAFFWAAMVKRSWIDRVVLMACVLPLAVFVNAVRITTAGLLYQMYDDPGIKQRIHDISGYLMIPVAFGLLWLVKEYWERLYRPLEQVTAREFVRKPA